MKRWIYMAKLAAVMILTAVITCCDNGSDDNAESGKVGVNKVILDRTVITLAKDGKCTLEATVTPSTASDKSVLWSSDAPAIVTVGAATGEMEALAPGEAFVTATSVDGGRSASCKVIVTRTLNILFIGNSFTEDAVQHLPGIVAAAGLKNIKMVHMNYGGRTMKEHSDGYSTLDDYRCFRCASGSGSWIRDYGRYTVQDIVKEDEWSVITIQEHTGRTAAWEWTAEHKAVIQNYISNMKVNQSGLPEFAYIMSQAYGNPKVISSYGQIKVLTDNFSSQDEMYRTIVSRARKVLDETSVDRIIATGTTLQNLRSSSLNTPYDLTRDGYHMDLGLARYAAACTVFESVIPNRIDDVTLNGNNYRFSTSSTVDTEYSTPVTNSNAPVAISAARYAVAEPFEETLMSDLTQNNKRLPLKASVLVLLSFHALFP